MQGVGVGHSASWAVGSGGVRRVRGGVRFLLCCLAENKVAFRLSCTSPKLLMPLAWSLELFSCVPVFKSPSSLRLCFLNCKMKRLE